MKWFLVWVVATAALLYYATPGVAVVASLVVGLFALLRSGALKWS